MRPHSTLRMTLLLYAFVIVFCGQAVAYAASRPYSGTPLGYRHLPAAVDPLRQDPYPPTEPTPESPAIPVVAQPYPPRAEDIFATPEVVGTDSLQAGVIKPTQVTVELTTRSLVYLWLGFLAALTIFVACVVGAIIMLARRNPG